MNQGIKLLEKAGQVEDIAALIVEEYFFHCNEQERKKG